MKVKIVAFDVNGTLFDDTRIFWNAISGIFSKYGMKPLPLEILQKNFGQPRTKIYRDNGITEEMASDADLYKIYNELYQNQDYPLPASGLDEILEWLLARKLRLAIVSTQQNTITLPLLEKYGLQGLFFKISGSVSDKAAALCEIAALSGISIDEVVYVGDQEGDIRHAKKAGCVSIAFCGGLHEHERLKKVNPDFIIETMYDLKNLSIFKAP